MADNSKATPDTLSAAHAEMLPYWCMVDAILGGAPTMRKGADKYLPRFQNETITKDSKGISFDPYAQRLLHAPLTNIYEDISKSLAAKPFNKELKLKDGTEQTFLDLAENIDGQGHIFHVFGEAVFKAGLDKGVDWILVDHTNVPPGATLAAERAMGARPYWVRIPCERLLAVYSDFVNGQEIIYHARISEPVLRVVDYQEVCINRVRVLERAPSVDDQGKATGYGSATWAVYEERSDDKNVTSWVLVDNGVITIGVIPLVPFIPGGRVGSSWVVEPPLKTLAYLQIEEFQQESCLKNIQELTCFPMLTGNGVSPPEDGIVPVGPRAVLFAPMGADGTIGSWAFIEPSAESIQKVMERLKNTQTDMRDIGMQPLTQSNLTVITTGQVAMKANNSAQAWAIRFKDALEQAWKLTAMWLKSTVEPEVEVFMDFGADVNGAETATVLGNAEGRGVISKKTERDELRRRNILSANNDEDDEEKRLAEEQQGLQPEQPIDPVTGKPLNRPAPPAVQ
jgi:hypothetical protein